MTQTGHFCFQLFKIINWFSEQILVFLENQLIQKIMQLKKIFPELDTSQAFHCSFNRFFEYPTKKVGARIYLETTKKTHYLDVFVEPFSKERSSTANLNLIDCNEEIKKLVAASKVKK